MCPPRGRANPLSPRQSKALFHTSKQHANQRRPSETSPKGSVRGSKSCILARWTARIAMGSQDRRRLTRPPNFLTSKFASCLTHFHLRKSCVCEPLDTSRFLDTMFELHFPSSPPTSFPRRYVYVQGIQPTTSKTKLLMSTTEQRPPLMPSSPIRPSCVTPCSVSDRQQSIPPAAPSRRCGRREL